MTARTVATGPCWVLEHQTHGELDVIPHFESELEALMTWAQECDETRDEWLLPPTADIEGLSIEDEYSCWSSSLQRQPNVCVELVCDGCGLVLDNEHGGAWHLESTEVDHLIDICDWKHAPETGLDYCPDCDPPTPQQDDAGDRRPGPNDRPLWGGDSG